MRIFSTPAINQICNIQNRNKLPFKAGISTDTFECTTKPVQKNDLLQNWLNNNDLLKKDLEEILSNEENLIGKGFQGGVYKIPNNEDYVLKINNCTPAPKFNDMTVDISENKRGQNLDVNIGQSVATIKVTDSFFPIQMIDVLKKQEGESLGVPPYAAIAYENGDLKADEVEYEDITRKEKYAQSLEKLAQLPVSSYENLLETIVQASKNGYHFDHLNTNNLLLDSKTQSINPIDMNPLSSYLNFGDILYSLTNINYFGTYIGAKNPVSEKDVAKAINNTKEICSKYFSAMKNKGLKLDKNMCSMEFLKLMGSYPFILTLQSSNNHEQWQKLIEMGICEN